MTTPSPPSALRSVFRHRDFRLFFGAALVSNSANWLQNVIVPFLMLELTDSNGWVGAASFASLFPAFCLTPIAGVLADRVPRRLILLCTQSVQATVAMGYFILWQGDAITPWWIISLQLMSGFASGFQVSAWQSFVPLLVPRRDLLTAVRLNSVQFTVARALGPLAAIILLSAFDTGVAFVVNAATFALVGAAVVVAKPRQVMSEAAHEPFGRVLREGIRFVRRHASLRQAATTGFVISFLGQPLAFALSPGLADQVYGNGPTGQRMLLLAVGSGSLIATTWVIGLGDSINRSRQAIGGLVAYSLGVFLVSATPWFVVGMIGFFISGMAHLTVAVALNTSLQIQVHDSIRGRVLSIYFLGVLGGLPLGALVEGLLADAFGLRPVIFAMAVLFATYVLYAIHRIDGLRALDVDSLPGEISDR